MRGIVLAVCLGLSATILPAQTPATHLLIITGVSGEPTQASNFQQWAAAAYDAATARFGVPLANVIYLAEKPDADRRIAGRSDKVGIARALQEVAQRSRPQDQVLLLMIGHGSAEGGGPRFNIPGPDITAADLGELLDKITDRRIAIVNTTSASGPFVEALSAPGRVIITATRSAAEKNETAFAAHFVKALKEDVADTNKDGGVSLLEAFNYSRQEVARYYEQEQRLATEHALLEDNGDAKGSMEPAPDGDGKVAAAFVLRAGAAKANTDPALRPLLAEKQRIEQAIEALKQRKPNMSTAAYDAELEKLLLQLTAANAAIRKAEGKP